MKTILFLLCFAMTSSVFASIYVNQNPNGSVEYTDTPSENSTKVEVPSVNSITPKTVSTEPGSEATDASSSASSGASDEAKSEQTSTSSTYQQFNIKSPTNGTNIQNQPTIPVEMDIVPNIKPGDKIQLMLDDKPAGTPSSTAYQELGLVERGTHSLYAIIVNNKNEPIKNSSTVTFSVHRNSIITSPATQKH